MTRHESSPPTCPELEDLAAFLDRRLAPAERDRIAAHLAECDRCYELFTESRRFLEEEAKGGVVAAGAFGAGGRLRRGLAAAATAAAIVAAVVVWGPFGGRAGGAGEAAARLTERVDLLLAGAGRPPAAALVAPRSWSESRGAAGGRSAPARAFRLGVLLVDLETAVRTGERERALELLPGIERLVGGLELPDLILATYRELDRGLRQGEESEALSDLCRAAAAEVASGAGEESLFDLGSWAEATRLAVAGGTRRPSPPPGLGELPGGELRAAAGRAAELAATTGTAPGELTPALDKLLELGGDGR